MSWPINWGWPELSIVSGMANTLIALLIRVTIIFFLGIAVTHLWRSASAAQRHLVWSAVCCGALLLPLLQIVVPKWRLNVVPAEYAALPTMLRAFGTTPPTPPPATAEPTRVSTAPVPTHPRSKALTPPGDQSPDWRLLCLLGLGGIWIAGTFLILASLIHSHRMVAQILAVAAPLEEQRIGQMLRACARRLKWRRSVEIKEHPSMIPMACGILYPTIVLPRTAQDWDDTTLRNVLMHEMAHVVRRDGLTQVAASFVCALYWFHPCAWYVARRLRQEREYACDDLVIRTGGLRTEYATDLLELASTFTLARTVALTALPFARPSQVYARLMAISDRAKSRAAVSTRTVAVAMTAMIGLGTMTAACSIGSHEGAAAAEERFMERFAKTQQRTEAAFLEGLSLTESTPFSARLTTNFPWSEAPTGLRPKSLAVISADSASRIALIVANDADTAVVLHPRLIALSTNDTLHLERSTADPSQSHSLVSWLRVLPDIVRLEPHERRTITVTASPPSDAAPGVYYAFVEIPEWQFWPNKALRLDGGAQGSHWVDISADSSGPFLLLYARKAIEPVHLYADSLTLTGRRVCVRMWTERGAPYFGAIQLSVSHPFTWNQWGRALFHQTWEPLYTEAISIALDGVASPTRYCKTIPKLSNYRGEQIQVNFVPSSGWWAGDLFGDEKYPRFLVTARSRLPLQ